MPPEEKSKSGAIGIIIIIIILIGGFFLYRSKALKETSQMQPENTQNPAASAKADAHAAYNDASTDVINTSFDDLDKGL